MDISMDSNELSCINKILKVCTNRKQFHIKDALLKLFKKEFDYEEDIIQAEFLSEDQPPLLAPKKKRSYKKEYSFFFCAESTKEATCTRCETVINIGGPVCIGLHGEPFHITCRKDNENDNPFFSRWLLKHNVNPQ